MNVEINITLVNSGLSLLFRVIFAHLKRPFGLLLFPVEEGRASRASLSSSFFACAENNTKPKSHLKWPEISQIVPKADKPTLRYVIEEYFHIRIVVF